MDLRTVAAVGLCACAAGVLAGCGGDEAAAPRRPALRGKAVGLTSIVAFTRRCGVVPTEDKPGHYVVLGSRRASCRRALRYVGGLAGASLPRFAEHWNCVGDPRSGQCVDGAFTVGFSWDIVPAPSA